MVEAQNLAHGKSGPAIVYTGPDHSTYHGATRLARRIRAYWRQRGVSIKTRVVNDGYDPSVGHDTFSVRSDLVMPVRFAR